MDFLAFYYRFLELEGDTLAEKAEAYLLSIGLKQKEIDNIKEIMLEE